MDGSVIHEPFPSFNLLGSVPSSSHTFYDSLSRSTDFSDRRMLPWTGGMPANAHFQFSTTYCTSIRPLKPVTTPPPPPAFSYRTSRYPAAHSPPRLQRKRHSRGRERPVRARSKGIRGYRVSEGKFPRPGASAGNSRAAWWNDASSQQQEQGQSGQQRFVPRASVSSPAPLMPRSPRNTSSFIIRQHESLSSPAAYAATSPMILQRPDAVAAAFAADSASPTGAPAIAAVATDVAAAAAAGVGAHATGIVLCDKGELGVCNSEYLPGLAADMADMADMAPLLSVNPYGSMSGCIRLRTPEPVHLDTAARSEREVEGTRILPRRDPPVSRAECSEGASCSKDIPLGRAVGTEERAAVAGFDVRFFEVVCDMLVVAPACDGDVSIRDAAAAAAGADTCHVTGAVGGAGDGSDSVLRARIDEQEVQLSQLEEENRSLQDRLEMRQEELRRLRMRLQAHSSAAIEMEGETDGTQHETQPTCAPARANPAAAVAAGVAISPRRRSASPSSAVAAVAGATAAADPCPCECDDDGYVSSSS